MTAFPNAPSRSRAAPRCARPRTVLASARAASGRPRSRSRPTLADRSRSEAERAQRGRPREEASGRSDAGSNDTGAWFERRLREPSFVIPEIADFRRQRADASTALGRAQRGAAREREGAFGNAVITAEVRYSSVTKYYHPAGGVRTRTSRRVILPAVTVPNPGAVERLLSNGHCRTFRIGFSRNYGRQYGVWPATQPIPGELIPK